jgi:dihydrodipicolinate synthase/N-acetylneuraminate lyase
MNPSEFRDQSLRGVWAAIPLPWDGEMHVDSGLLYELVAAYKAAGLNGVYTTGTDGEFHVLEADEFERVVAAFARAVSDVGIAGQVGVTWLHTEGVLRRIAISSAYGIDAVQVALPFWEPLNDRELLGFFEDMTKAFPEVALIHYNIFRAKRILRGTDYQKILEVSPNLVGTKQTGGDLRAFEEVVLETPTLHHFVVDPNIVPGVLYGAKGTYSAVANISSRWMVDWWTECERGDWPAATRRKLLLDRMDAEAVALLPHITAEPAWSKLYARSGIAPTIPLTVRAPYLAASEEDAVAFRGLLQRSYPELVERT